MLLVFLPQVAQLQGRPDWAEEGNRLEENGQLWESHDFRNYSFLMNGEFLACNHYLPAKVLVEDNNVVAVLNPDTGEPLRRRGSDPGDLSIEERDNLFKTIDAFFIIVEDAILNHEGTSHPGPKSSSFAVEYDEYFGHPRLISLEYDHSIDEAGNRYRINDSFVRFEISDFIPSP